MKSQPRSVPPSWRRVSGQSYAGGSLCHPSLTPRPQPSGSVGQRAAPGSLSPVPKPPTHTHFSAQLLLGQSSEVELSVSIPAHL